MISWLARILSRVAIALAVALAVAGCDSPTSPGSAGEARGVLTLGLLPDEDRLQQSARYAPLLEKIRSEIGFDIELALPASYRELVELFAAGKIDVAYFGGYTFSLANERHGAVPLVMRDIDARFVSHVIVRIDNDEVRELADLRGLRFSFGSRESTSGHIMPRYYFTQAGIFPEDFFSRVTFSGAHDLTIRQVADGTVDAGVANGQIVRSMLEKHEGGTAPVRIVWQSPPYVDNVWAVQPTMTEATRQAILAVFLSLSRDDERQRQFLDAVGARYYVPASSSDFDALRRALESVRQGHGL